MYIKRFLFAIAALVSISVHAQGPSEICDLYAPIAMDAQLNIRLDHKNIPHETQKHFMAMVGTNGPEIATQRGMIAFDLSALPTGIEIDSAFLYLTYRLSPANYTHEWTSGSNACVLQRVVEPWSASTVTWNNQPEVTQEDQAPIPATVSTDQNSGFIEVTQMVQKWVNQPDSNFGLLFRLLTEEGYRRQTYASSDDPNQARHPKLRIVYKCNQLGIDHKEAQTRVIPILGGHRVASTRNVEEMWLIDLNGHRLAYSSTDTMKHGDLASGIYILQVRFEDGAIWNKKLLIEQ